MFSFSFWKQDPVSGKVEPAQVSRSSAPAGGLPFLAAAPLGQARAFARPALGEGGIDEEWAAETCGRLIALARGDAAAAKNHLKRARRLFLEIGSRYDARQVAAEMN
ncbi:MAG: hypothetical protein AB1556_02985 [Bacillota bacterium]